ncbi:MAG: hypothetical protein HY202_03425 [Nitrospirae bacterium]|nr:hypothetical protein [Nitrospirota bacterium]MBI3605061.1 hypothetical protein [Nitrospirota bacterium]
MESAAYPLSEDIRGLKNKLAELNHQLGVEEKEREALEREENRLTENIRGLKVKAQSKPNLLLNLRIENGLKVLRSVLEARQQTNKRETLIHDELLETKRKLETQVENEIRREIALAQEAFTRGDEAEADGHYKEALQLMEEQKQYQTEPPAHPKIISPPLNVNALLAEKETPDQLRELADFARNDVETFTREIKSLQENKNRTQEEINIRKNLIKYPGLLERGENSAPLQKGTLEQELLKLEKTGKIIDNQIVQYKGALHTLERQIKKIEFQIKQKEK